MEYIYAAMLIHKAGKEIKEQNVKKVLEAAGIKVDEARVKALIAAIEGVDIEDAISKAAPVAAPAGAPAPSGEAPAKEEEKKEEKEEEKISEEEAAEGLGSLFG